MRAFVNAKAVIIGMGFLMEYIFPCWKNAMGAKVSVSYASGEEVLINFTPHLVPMNRGILATSYAALKKKMSYEEVKAVYDKYYKDEYFVRVLEKDVYPETRWVEGSNFVDVNFKIDERTGRIIMMGAIDNVVKGAAGQAVQNMNIMFGLEENTGLKMVPMFP